MKRGFDLAEVMIGPAVSPDFTIVSILSMLLRPNRVADGPG
jgi:hypothetical protein